MKDSSTPVVRRTTKVAFGMVDAGAIRDPSLPSSAKLVYTYLATYADNVRSAFPSRGTIARELGISVRTVDAGIKAAEDAGLITVERRDDKKTGRQTSNLYLLHDLGGSYKAGSGPKTRGADSAPSPVQDLRPPRANSAPELDQRGETTKESSPTARPHSVERGRTRSAKPADKRASRRADYPTDNAWIVEGDADATVWNIVAHVEELFGEIPGLDPLLQSKVTPKLDPETFEELPFDEPAARHLMNIALKAGRWGTVNFRWIKQQEAAGKKPSDEPAPDPSAAMSA